MALITTRFFLFRLKLKWLKNGGAKLFFVTCIFFRIITRISTISFTGSSLKNDHNVYLINSPRKFSKTSLNSLYKKSHLIFKTCSLFTSRYVTSIKKIYKDGDSYFHKNQTYRPLEKILRINSWIFIYEVFQKMLNVLSNHSFQALTRCTLNGTR